MYSFTTTFIIVILPKEAIYGLLSFAETYFEIFLQAFYHPTLLGFDIVNVLWINSDLMVLKLELDCMFTVFDSLTVLRTLLITNHLVCQVLQHISILCDFAQYSQF